MYSFHLNKKIANVSQVNTYNSFYTLRYYSVYVIFKMPERYI